VIQVLVKSIKYDAKHETVTVTFLPNGLRALTQHPAFDRVTQIMNLLNLAPDIQKELIFLAKHNSGRESIMEKASARSRHILLGASNDKCGHE
jgi:hypothetical protein